MPNDLQRAQRRIAKLETELDEMTIALSQAWDQLVPLLQDQPAIADELQDILLLLDSLMLATDSTTAAIYVAKTQTWRSVPVQNIIPLPLMQAIQHGPLPDNVWTWENNTGEQWIFAPLMVGQTVEGSIGIGLARTSSKDVFTAVDMKLLRRLADRISGQMAEVQLALSREKADKMTHELEIASTIQRSIQPIRPPQLLGVDIAAYWQPARLVGGDAWGWVQQSTGELCLFILDVAGKGLPAALGATSLHAAIRIGLRANMSPADVLSMVNDEFYETYTATDLLTTATIIRVDPTTGRFEQANAGHPPTLIYHGDTWHELGATMPPLGVLEGLQPSIQTLELTAGDRFICYSDGFSEIETIQGLWGQTGIKAAATQPSDSAQTIVDAIIKAAAIVQRSTENQDDQTLIAGCIVPKE